MTGSRPTPIRPLTRKMGKASPYKPCPQEFAQRPSSAVENESRQKLASAPPMRLAERHAQTMEADQRMVVRNAANTAGS